MKRKSIEHKQSIQVKLENGENVVGRINKNRTKGQEELIGATVGSLINIIRVTDISVITHDKSGEVRGIHLEYLSEINTAEEIDTMQEINNQQETFIETDMPEIVHTSTYTTEDGKIFVDSVRRIDLEKKVEEEKKIQEALQRVREKESQEMPSNQGENNEENEPKSSSIEKWKAENENRKMINKNEAAEAQNNLSKYLEEYKRKKYRTKGKTRSNIKSIDKKAIKKKEIKKPVKDKITPNTKGKQTTESKQQKANNRKQTTESKHTRNKQSTAHDILTNKNRKLTVGVSNISGVRDIDTVQNIDSGNQIVGNHANDLIDILLDRTKRKETEGAQSTYLSVRREDLNMIKELFEETRMRLGKDNATMHASIYVDTTKNISNEKLVSAIQHSGGLTRPQCIKYFGSIKFDQVAILVKLKELQKGKLIRFPTGFTTDFTKKITAFPQP